MVIPNQYLARMQQQVRRSWPNLSLSERIHAASMLERVELQIAQMEALTRRACLCDGDLYGEGF